MRIEDERVPEEDKPQTIGASIIRQGTELTAEELAEREANMELIKTDVLPIKQTGIPASGLVSGPGGIDK